MTERIERYQVWVYVAAILLGLWFGTAAPQAAEGLEGLVWPALGLLLYSTFVQVPLTRLPEAFADVRFLAAVVIGNFVFIPLVVWILLPLAGDDPAVALGVLLVLLVPCTDWFLTFTQLSGGDTRRGVAATPVNLLLQIVLLPVYLWLFLGEDFSEVIVGGRVVAAFTTLIVIPLVAAWVTQRILRRTARRERSLVARIAFVPVPMVAIVVFLIAASQVTVVRQAAGFLNDLAVVYVSYLVAAAAVGLLLARFLRLNPDSSTTLIFSLGTRNSFVVLPFAVALPSGYEAAVVAVVFQSLIELFGMLAYLKIVPWAVGRVEQRSE